jgi:hypothetical protein
MLDFHVMTLSDAEKSGIQDHLKNIGIKGTLDILAYIACNNGIRHGPTMGQTFEAMKQKSTTQYGSTAELCMITSGFQYVPKVIAARRRATTGPFGNEPFDAIVYRVLQNV